jgi:hypothetical protein
MSLDDPEQPGFWLNSAFDLLFSPSFVRLDTEWAIREMIMPGARPNWIARIDLAAAILTVPAQPQRVLRR